MIVLHMRKKCMYAKELNIIRNSVRMNVRIYVSGTVCMFDCGLMSREHYFSYKFMPRIVLHTIISKVYKRLALEYVNGRSVDVQNKHGVRIKCLVTGYQRPLLTNRYHLVSLVSCF